MVHDSKVNEEIIFRCPHLRLRTWSRKAGLAASALSFSTHRPSLVLVHGVLSSIPLSATASIFPNKCSRVSSDFIGSHGSILMAFTAESSPTQS